MSAPTLFDPEALALKRARAHRSGQRALFLHIYAATQVSERLSEVNKSFTSVAIVTAFAAPWRTQLPGSTIIAEAELLDFSNRRFDLVIHALGLHACNDPVGQMVQCRRAMPPDGLFMAVLFGGKTLHELRAALAQAEVETTGGLSPRISPMPELRDLGGLLQRAGFALPVADRDVLNVTYTSAVALMADLRAMGETNVLADRIKTFSRRAVLQKAAQIYAENFPAGKNRVAASFELITLTGWAPDDSQQKPLRPGSAQSRLASALGTVEQTDFAAPATLDP